MAEYKISRLRYRWRGEWATATSYIKDDVIQYAGSSWYCIRAHTSDNFLDEQEYLAQPADTEFSPAWLKMTEGQSFGGTWTANTVYVEGDVVQAGGNLYKCNETHLSSSFFNTDILKWDVYAVGSNWRQNWAANTVYRVGDIVKYNGITYQCIYEHTSSTVNFGIVVGDATDPEDSVAVTWKTVVDNVEYRGEYANATRYRQNDLVKYSGRLLLCITEHTSSNVILYGANTAYWQTKLPGFNHFGDWAPNTYYAPGDVVRHGGSIYVANNYSYNDGFSNLSVPGETVLYPYGHPDWALISKGINFLGEWNANTDYKAGEIVTRGGYLYLSLTNTISDGSSLDYLDSSNWEIIFTGSNYLEAWENNQDYALGDTVIYKGTTYKANKAHLSSSQNYPGDNGSGFNYWDILIQGDQFAGLETSGDLLTYNLSRSLANDGSTLGPTRVPIGQEDEVLYLTNDSGDLDYKKWGTMQRVFHVRTNGIDDDDDTDRGVNFWKPYRTVRFAAEKANDDFAGTTTIKVYSGEYEETLPIIVPARTAIVGEELRSTTIKAAGPVAALASDATYTLAAINRLINIIDDVIIGTIITKSAGNTLVQNTTYTGNVTSGNAAAAKLTAIYNYIDFRLNAVGSLPTLSGSNTLVTDPAFIQTFSNLEANKNFLAQEAVSFVNVNYPAYTFDGNACKRDVKRYVDAMIYDLKYTGNYKSILAARYYVNAVLGSAGEDMFYVRDSSGIRNLTVKGLEGTLAPQNQDEIYQRPTGGAYVSLDPGWGPNDQNVWITTRSCYVQNVTTFGTAAIGQKIDGSLHNGGNRSIVSNDFTQVISDGIGAWVTNGGRAELVSVFTYYAHIGMFAEDGGIIRATNGNSSYGTYGAVADGNDPDETPQIAKVNTRDNQAQIAAAFAGEVNDYVLVLEFANAGQEYTTASYSVVSSGTGVQIVQEEYRDNAVFEAQVLSTGSDYILAGNNAQSGNTTTITLASNEEITQAEILGTRIIITSGPGTGQYGYVYSYNAGTKLCTVYKESDSTPGWDHVVPGTHPTTLLTTGTRYKFEPRVTFSDPGYTATEITLGSSGAWCGVTYGETTSSYTAIPAVLGSGSANSGKTNATFNITRTSREYTSVTLVDGGRGYAVDDIVAISGSNLGGDNNEHDIFITVVAVTSDGENTITEFEYTGQGTSGVFVVTPTTSDIGIYSRNGTTWTNFSLPASGLWKAVAAGSNKFVAIAYNSNQAASSNDGITWTSRTMPASKNWNSVVYGDGLFVAVAGDDDAGAYSTNGTTWSSTTLANVGDSTFSEWVDITYGKQKYVAIANSNNAIAIGTYSGGVMTWVGSVIEVQDSSPKNWVSIAFGNNRYVAISTTGDVSYSFDALTWYTTAAGMPQPSATEMYWKKIRYAQGVFFAVCQTDSQAATTFAATSYDGISWTSRSLNSSLRYSTIGFGNPDVTTGDSSVFNSSPMWIAVGENTSANLAKVVTGARALGRAIVESGTITQIRLWEPGSGYTDPPTLTLTDPNNTTEFLYRTRMGDGVLAQPSFISRGLSYKTSTTSVTVSGDGYADIIPIGRFLTIDNLTTVPGPGAQLYIGGRPDYFTVVVTGINVSQIDGTFKSTVRISPPLDVTDDIRHDMEIIIRELYSQVRITGHDFLDVGSGNFTQTNYPGLYVDYEYESSPQNEVRQENGGRVFYTSTDQDGNFRAGELFAVEQATGIVTISADFFNLDGLTEIALGGVILGGSGTVVREFSTDPLFTQNSNNIVPTQRAIKSYLESRLNIGGEDLLTTSFVAGTVRVGPNLIENTAGLQINIPVLANFSGPAAHISGSWLASNFFYRSFRDDGQG